MSLLILFRTLFQSSLKPDPRYIVVLPAQSFTVVF